ncbi:heavy metal translocating P-type ATPase [Trinickia caryophylli]|uniref:P-type Zn(2+) transporter n=1 Tax=Trinickia caryophylli TaxID=28094 RepID=A0A1X7GQH1_TRICW|nr:heavy metal translocating P-type ATPase [Trinickia caryophylli]PMS10534.1 heavy metal translocating P-type ATPase [Trinickia caryophylli]TRX19072.1 heavy metal translocating P-type ATPase [Trinickia caryophylli]WQE10128.1 heavy metal translocating P-type ATPase [Trinickia caryophylli]SMF73164.1 Cd2+/Zn2+-exporting ATPase [Trinickia caryophylli]GLU35149.1 heavy metal resistance membrane ATPase [Trinickia caryophylli]
MSEPPHQAGCAAHVSCCDHEHEHAPERAALPLAEETADGVRTAIRIMQMDCPTEERLIRDKLTGMAGVSGLEFNLMQRVLTVVHAPDARERILDTIRSLGFIPEVVGGTQPATAATVPMRRWWPLAVGGAAAAAAAAEAVSWMGLPGWFAGALGGFAIAFSGLGTYRKGWISIRNGQLNINALMSIAVTGAMLLGQWPEAAMVMVLFALAELIEAKSLDRARNAIEGLMRLAPEMATVQQADGSWATVRARDVALGALVRVQPGERIALDGAVVEGRSTVNEAAITGESLPVEKGVGDAVFAGTVNEAGSFHYRVRAAAGDTTLARIIHAVEAAQGKKAATQRFVDRFSRIYTPIVVAMAAAVAVIAPLALGGGWREWIYRALVLLVIACPCALVISTPVTIVSALAAAARRGILIKGGVYLEQGRRLRWLALDKTGTLTHGKPVRTDFEPCGALGDADCLRLAASLGARSNHPVSRAIAASAGAAAAATVAGFEALPGQGVAGVIDGQRYWLGNHALVEATHRCVPEIEARLERIERQGKTAVVLFDERHPLAVFGVADTVKETSRVAVAELHRLGIRTAMLTGDNAHTARAIGDAVGIDDARGGQLPEDKLRAVESLAAGGAVVGMVGDGINDAPALARAHIGFAMGALGTDAAIETADVALMDDDLRKIASFVRLSRATHAVLVQNIVFALAIKLVFFGLTLAGLGTMWMAVFADAGASLVVVGNGLRLLRK